MDDDSKLAMEHSEHETAAIAGNLDKEPCYQEVVEGIKNVQNNKAIGTGRICSELVKMGGKYTI